MTRILQCAQTPRLRRSACSQEKRQEEMNVKPSADLQHPPSWGSHTAKHLAPLQHHHVLYPVVVKLTSKSSSIHSTAKHTEIQAATPAQSTEDCHSQDSPHQPCSWGMGLQLLRHRSWVNRAQSVASQGMHRLPCPPVSQSEYFIPTQDRSVKEEMAEWAFGTRVLYIQVPESGSQ